MNNDGTVKLVQEARRRVIEEFRTGKMAAPVRYKPLQLGQYAKGGLRYRVRRMLLVLAAHRGLRARLAKQRALHHYAGALYRRIITALEKRA